MRATSKTTARTAATIIEITADAGSWLKPFVIRSATPFHCSAAGMGNCSETMVDGRTGAVRPRRQKEQEEERHRRQRAREDADDVADRLLPRLGAEHVAGLDVREQVRRVRRDLGGHASPGSGWSPG